MSFRKFRFSRLWQLRHHIHLACFRWMSLCMRTRILGFGFGRWIYRPRNDFPDSSRLLTPPASLRWQAWQGYSPWYTSGGGTGYTSVSAFWGEIIASGAGALSCPVVTPAMTIRQIRHTRTIRILYLRDPDLLDMEIFLNYLKSKCHVIFESVTKRTVSTYRWMGKVIFMAQMLFHEMTNVFGLLNF